MITFFLDMDGVCCNFVKASAILFDKPDIELTWQPGVAKLRDVLKIDDATFWNKIDAQGSEFWLNMPEYPWFMDLYTSLKLLGDVVFCTSPSLDGNSFKGKIEWLQKRFGKEFRNYIFTSKKFYVANYPDSVLIDDDDEKILAFKKNGGKTILFPQIWNQNYHLRNDRIKYVLQETAKLRKK
jgi:5'(3')-deoxyribonucleotidase